MYISGFHCWVFYLAPFVNCEHFEMKIIYAEYLKDYSSYTFSYVPYAVYQSRNQMTEIYDSGYLPYTGNVKLNHHLYYKARSVRINLKKFEMGSENRRVKRKFDPYKVIVDWIPIEDFNTKDADFVAFCTEYSRRRFKGGEMESDRLKYILDSPFLTHIAQFEIDGKNAGYVFLSRNEKLVHYWYSFYELDEFQDLPLGKYLMMKILWQSKELGRTYCYLGTCYGPHSLYKVRDFKGVEFSDGSRWSNDISQLKSWCKNDDSDMHTDRFKGMPPDKANQYISSLLDSSDL